MPTAANTTPPLLTIEERRRDLGIPPRMHTFTFVARRELAEREPRPPPPPSPPPPPPLSQRPPLHSFVKVVLEGGEHAVCQVCLLPGEPSTSFNAIDVSDFHIFDELTLAKEGADWIRWEGDQPEDRGVALFARLVLPPAEGLPPGERDLLQQHGDLSNFDAIARGLFVDDLLEQALAFVETGSQHVADLKLRELAEYLNSELSSFSLDLLTGWRAEQKKRRGGRGATYWEYYSPTGRRFRSQPDVLRHFQNDDHA